MARIENSAFVQALQQENCTVSFGVTLNADSKYSCDIQGISVKCITPEKVECCKLAKYIAEKRLVIIAQDQEGKLTIYQKRADKSSFETGNLEYIRFIDRSAAVSPIIRAEKLSAVKDISDEEYEEFRTSCLENGSDCSKSQNVEAKELAAARPNSQHTHHRPFSEMHSIPSFIAQIPKILKSLFRSKVQANWMDVEKRKTEEKRYQERCREILYQNAQTRLRKEAEQESIEKRDII